jgi:hypothetical protein
MGKRASRLIAFERILQFVRDFPLLLPYKFGIQAEIVCQGRRLSADQLSWLRQWIGCHPDWSRSRLSQALSEEWDWRNGRGQFKNFAARSLLEKLADRGLLDLPPLRLQCSHPRPKPGGVAVVDWPKEPVTEALSHLLPLEWMLPKAGQEISHRFDAYVQSYHYLGLRVIGENMKYLIGDRQGRDLACLLFGAAAWQVSTRDQFVGWNEVQRAARLHYLTNNTRFLILPWVKAQGLASCLLSQVVRRISQDWQVKYGHPLYLLESFVQRNRFTGTCYQAANWLCVGQTRGRGRQGPNPLAPTEQVKDIFVYPLHRQFRQRLLEAA